MLRAEPHCIYCRVHHRITFRLLQPCCRFPRSCDTLKRAIDFVNNQGPHDKLGEQTKELDSISTASTIVSLGSTYERVCWNGQLAIMWICVITVIDMKLYFLASIFFRFLTELVCADVFSYIVYWRLSLTNDVSTFFFGPLYIKNPHLLAKCPWGLVRASLEIYKINCRQRLHTSSSWSPVRSLLVPLPSLLSSNGQLLWRCLEIHSSSIYRYIYINKCVGICIYLCCYSYWYL